MEWKKRLLVEYTDLNEKINKLEAYLANNNVKECDENSFYYKEYKIMLDQLNAMRLYFKCLEKRILLIMGE